MPLGLASTEGLGGMVDGVEGVGGRGVEQRCSGGRPREPATRRCFEERALNVCGRGPAESSRSGPSLAKLAAPARQQSKASWCAAAAAGVTEWAQARKHGLPRRRLTFELSGRRRQGARPGLATMYRVPPDRAWRPAVGAPLERGVRRSPNDEGAVLASEETTQGAMQLARHKRAMAANRRQQVVAGNSMLAGTGRPG